MPTMLKQWIKEVHSVVHFLWAKEGRPVETHCELLTVYGANVMIVRV
jgi:hypothetical protein